MKSFQSCVMLHNQSQPVSVRQIYCGSDMAQIPFPPDTKAFLYYSTPPERLRISGELRLRVTSCDDPASFDSGSDLMKPNGQPWSRPVFFLPRYYKALYGKLREERLVSDDLDAVLSTFTPKLPKYNQSQLLYTFNDTFIVDFMSCGHLLTVITEQGMETLQFTGPTYESRGRRIITPYTGAYTNHRPGLTILINLSVGSALARFERSTLPEHKGTRHVVLRFVKMITPVNCVIPLYDGYIAQPEEGELHRKYPKIPKSLHPPVWSVNIDNPKGVMVRGLRLLWDT
jgi:hypothetical protein